MKKCFLFWFALIYFFQSSLAQISEGGLPISFSLSPEQSVTLIEPVFLTKPNVSVLLEEDAVNDALGRAFRVGTVIQVNLSPMNSGTWTTLADGSKLWQLQIRSKDAMALGLYFSEDVVLPVGSKLFAYNKNKRHVVGAFTSNTPRFQAMQMVEGDVITLEYHAPAHVLTYPTIHINEVTYFYRGVEDFVNDFREAQLMKAQPCQVDVACTPESNGWADQIRSVVHYTFTISGSTFVCSAATINNTANDCKPYILTAWHCGERSAGQSISSWIWYWNYQKASCAPNNNNQNPSKGNQTMTGGQVRASSGNGNLNNPPGNNQVAGSDFYLVELNSAIPSSYNPFFAGWDRSNTAATSGVGIHHPNGSAKKISTYTSTLVNSSFNGGANGHFWRVV
jgi:lysyl endopeptidase